MQGFTEHLNEKKKMCGEEEDKDLPFTPDVKKTKPSTPGKYGSAYSTVRNIARQEMQKQAKKKDVKEEAEVELQEASDSHKVMVTVSDPNHPAVTQRKEQIMKHVIVRAGDKGEAQAKAEAFYKKKGYKVHGSEYHSKQPATSMKTEEAQLDEKNTAGPAPGWMLKADPELKKKVDANTAVYKLAKKYAGKDLPKKVEEELKGDQHKLDVDKDGKIEKSDLEKLRSKKPKNEELEMKTFSQFVEEIQEIEEAKKDDYWDFKDLKDKEKNQPTSRKIAGRAYGGAAQKDDEDEDDNKPAKPAEKRGRGRPAGSKSGARQNGAAKKSYGGLTFHSLSLPNSNK